MTTDSPLTQLPGKGERSDLKVLFFLLQYLYVTVVKYSDSTIGNKVKIKSSFMPLPSLPSTIQS